VLLRSGDRWVVPSTSRKSFQRVRIVLFWANTHRTGCPPVMEAYILSSSPDLCYHLVHLAFLSLSLPCPNLILPWCFWLCSILGANWLAVLQVSTEMAFAGSRQETTACMLSAPRSVDLIGAPLIFKQMVECFFCSSWAFQLHLVQCSCDEFPRMFRKHIRQGRHLEGYGYHGIYVQISKSRTSCRSLRSSLTSQPRGGMISHQWSKLASGGASVCLGEFVPPPPPGHWLIRVKDNFGLGFRVSTCRAIDLMRRDQ